MIGIKSVHEKADLEEIEAKQMALLTALMTAGIVTLACIGRSLKGT